jgi:hypothetical protein
VPKLKVSTRDSGEVVEIRVRDNGTGIPAEIRDKLFQPFFTTKPTGEQPQCTRVHPPRIHTPDAQKALYSLIKSPDGL